MKKITMKFKISLVILLIGNVLLAQQALLIPPIIEGEDIDLTLQKSNYEFYKGIKTKTLGINGDVLGPTIVLNKGQLVNFAVHNQIGETTTIHWHGMHVAAKNDGGPHTTIEPGATWRPSFEILDKAATYWYHPHLHQKTNDHVLLGLAGLIIVKDEEEAQLSLPRTYGVDDIPVVIQTKTFNSAGQITLGTSAKDKVVFANATRNAYVNVPAQVIRLRLLNGASQRLFELGLSNNQTFYQIASDGGLLVKPIELTRLRLAPGERAEILIDLTKSKGETISLTNFGQELPTGYYGAKQVGTNPMMSIPNYNSNPLNGRTYEILELVVGEKNDMAITTIPNELVTVTPWSKQDVDYSRSLVFTPETFGPGNMVNGPFVIDGSTFKLDVINQRIKLDDVEIWNITNQTMIAHPFHIHDVQFYLLSRNGLPVPENEQGRKDVVIVPPQNGTVSFITKFENFTDDETPYMYHCHMLTHEDEGMMGQFLVDSTTTSQKDLDKPQNIICFPNPSSNLIFLQGAKSATVKVLNSVGILVDEFLATSDLTTYDVSALNKGLYLLYINLNGNITVIKAEVL